MKPNEVLFPSVAAWENGERQRERRAAQHAPRLRGLEPEDPENDEGPPRSPRNRTDQEMGKDSRGFKEVEVTVGLNTPVRVRDLETTEEITFTIVDGDDIDPSENRISFASPVGMALLWRRVGDSVRVALPHGQAHYEIIDLDVERGNP